MTIPSNRSLDSDYINLKGNHIKSGSSREVYCVIGHKDCVLKYNEKFGANENESNFFNHAFKNNQQGVLDSIGEVFSISLSGKYLVMEYLSDVSTDNAFSIDCPIEVNDPKRSNFGEIGNNIKIRDYALQDKPLPSGTLINRTVPSKDYESEMQRIADSLKGLI